MCNPHKKESSSQIYLETETAALSINRKLDSDWNPQVSGLGLRKSVDRRS